MHDAGTEWLIDAHGCAPARLEDPALLLALLRRVVAELDLRVIGEPLVHKFPAPGGVTAMLLLAESHLTCHSFPEHGYLSVNLYCCRPRPAWPWAERLGEAVGAREVSVRAVSRGGEG